MFRCVWTRSDCTGLLLTHQDSTFGTSIYTPGVPDVMRDFGVSETVAIVPLTTYAFGLAFGPMLAAPMSETLGRLGTYRLCLPISALFTLGAGFAPNMAGLCILRFLAGFFGGAPLPVTAGTGADLFDSKVFAVAGTLFLYAPFLGKDQRPASVLAND